MNFVHIDSHEGAAVSDDTKFCSSCRMPYNIVHTDNTINCIMFNIIKAIVLYLHKMLLCLDYHNYCSSYRLCLANGLTAWLIDSQLG